ncbi:MAG: phenylacetate-CoA oxygenase subunit PaaC [Ferruginibacter sp.]|nr:phenylacetate-CoA oxygenase subunit PaaC [Ferruginibacter sp.]
MNQQINFTLSLADTTLILAQRNSEWCAHGPILEQDIAITNISLDLLGQARNFYQHAAHLIGSPATEDSLAYLRTEREFKNLLITELPNGDWAQTILRQFFFSVYQSLLYTQLLQSKDEQLAAIAEKSLKEITYHIKWSSDWVIRLGDGTAESQQRMYKAIEYLWMYTGEFFIPADYETTDLSAMEREWSLKVKDVFEEAGLIMPEKIFMQQGGKTGNHTEHLGFILAEMQSLQRTYPGAQW